MLIDDSKLSYLIQSMSKTINRVERYTSYQFMALENDLKQVKETQKIILEKLNKILENDRK